MSITITADGNLRFIWADELSDLVQSGKPTITRASDVEPLPDGRWIADMGRVQGPVLGPYSKRVEALAAEHRWLEGKGY